MAQRLPRFDPNLQREDAAKVERLVEEAEVSVVARATAAGDSRRLRGVPVVGRGVGGTAPHTSPLGALMAKQRD